MSNISKKIAELSPEKLELLLKLRHQKQENSQKKEITPQSRETSLFPLSFAQQRLWFLDQLIPGNSLYNIPFALRLVGQLDILALKRSFNEIIRRHEILRTCFQTNEAKPVQLIASTFELTLATIDLQDLPPEKREDEVRKLASLEASQPFDLTQLPLLRVKLLRLAPTEHVLLLVMHHIISDGWSIGVFTRELAVLYEAFVTGKPSLGDAARTHLPELSVQYADFSVWQRQWLQQQAQIEQLQYWRKQLADITVLQLPTDYLRAAVQSYAGAIKILELPQNLKQALVQLSQQHDVTLFMTMLAAFKVLLHRYTGQTDIVVGSPIANRNRSEIEGLIGFFVNTLVMRTYLDANPSFSDLLTRVRKVALGAYAHQDLPFEKLVEELQPERNLSQNPLFQVWFNLLNFKDVQLQLSGLSVESIFIPEVASNFDLSLYVTEQKHLIQLTLVYNSDLFNADTIATMLLHYQTLLESIVANPEQQISTLPLLTETERYYLKSRGNVVCPSNPLIEFRKQDIEQSIPARFQEQVRKYPHKIAVHTKNYHWTYSDLNCHANQVAQAIQKQCTFQADKIALLFEHDAPMVAAILGVLKVGKTYVPLDPNYPSDRVVYILEDSLASVVITNNKNLARAQELIKGIIPLINIDDISFSGDYNEENLEISPDNIAYILYTSGSTGQPKGVIQNHRNVLHFIRNYTNNLHINEQDGFTLLSSYSFDAAIMDIFAAILNGATLYPIDIKDEGLTYLSQCLQQQKITIYHSTPTLYRHFISTLTENEQLNNIRLVVLGGEEVVKTDVDLYKQYFSDECIFINGLGPTESTVTLQYFINQQTEITRNTVPVGYPVEETEILLLNEAGQKTDIYGEIAIRSPYIALGYWQKPNLTQAVFLPDPECASRRIYRTGDLGRIRPDGSIEFLGRKDFQVKIRGFRIELGEIEAVLSQHPSVHSVVVIARIDTLGEQRLVAYIVPQHDCPTTISELRQFVTTKLPEYMVPSAIVMLESLPLTPNGKVDRRALPAPDLQVNRSASFVPPRDTIELQLTQIWSEVLELDWIGLQDNFFEVGGHSLLAVRLMAKIQQQLGKNLPLATLFQAPTIEQLAAILRQDLDSSVWSSLVKIQPSGSKLPFFCVPGAGGNVIYLYDLARHLDPDQPFYGLQAPGLDGGKFYTRVEDIALHYIKEIQTVQPQGPYLLGGHSFGGKVAFEMAIQLQKQGHEVALLAIFDTTAPIINYNKPITDDWDDAQWLTQFAKVAELLFKKNLKVFYADLQFLDPDEQFKYLLKQFEIANVLPLGTDIRQFRNWVQVFKANRQVDYVSHEVYPNRITLFRSSEMITDEAFGQITSEMAEDSAWGWDKVSAQPVDIHFVPGDHITMMTKPHVQVLAELLTKAATANG
ncbi:amino acid adenylation domain-containing protein [Nostoc sp. CENA67]|uniref:Amino acid adenylation domain-containing protein n=1 Tax=Amazonocrinis nigriterrae CENA67 TaxID=2794033 RepID=A0A8J7HKQ5_9NOST|nr:non-ribosomal peptide synthetase [Amazonocrinis nigriterrae]MBH8560937.1 amino acid adenylation domain-containing protein [Amazonocrinis nigriterrae CENA67]